MIIVIIDCFSTTLAKTKMLSSAGAVGATRRFAAISARRPSFFMLAQRPATAAAAVRQMSVITLSDHEAVDRFRMTNQKSILYFTATWCPPCKQIKPIYEKMATEYPKIAFGKVDVDDNQEASVEYEINAVPTFILFDGESPYERLAGADAGKLQQLVQDLDKR